MILASASPRRLELLEGLGFAPQVIVADIDEARQPGELPCAYVSRLAKEKADDVLARIGGLPAGEALVAADTIVHIGDGATLGKPADDAEAASMLRALSGATHQVSTGVCVMVGQGDACAEERFVETTDVSFYDLDDAEIAAYVASGEPRDKAGAYGIQATGRLLVRSIAGDYHNVVGLPVTRVVRALARLGYAKGDALMCDLLACRRDGF